MQVNSFWHGDGLSKLELVCINSFLKNGYSYNLYVYKEPVGVPPTVNLKSADAILPASKLFRYEAGSFNRGSLSGFANLFRYTLLSEIGGWWVDTDHCCLKPFSFEAEECYFQEPTRDASIRVVNGFFKASQGSAVLRYCLDVFERKNISLLVHGETGPLLLTEALRYSNNIDTIIPSAMFFPVPWWDYRRLLFDEALSLENCFTLHFWNAKITGDGYDKNGQYPEKSIFETLKRRYL